MPTKSAYFHLHLISDATGETLLAASRAVTSQYKTRQAIEHSYNTVRSRVKMDDVIQSIDESPGIVLYTVANKELGDYLEVNCKKIGIPCVNVLEPIFQVFQSYLGAPSERRTAAQHELNQNYFQRIDALNFTMMHDDGILPEDLEDADIILLGISRTSKTPTSIYLANRGVKTTNIPLVPGIKLPERVFKTKRPLIVALIASADRIHQVRHNRVLGLGQNALNRDASYTDRASISEELTETRKLCARNGWPVVDVTRKSIEESAATILSLLAKHREKYSDGAPND